MVKSWGFFVSFQKFLIRNFIGIVTFPVVPGTSNPKAPIPNAAFALINDSNKNTMVFGGSIATHSLPYAGILTAANAKSIDVKIDDGLIANGKMISNNESTLTGSGGSTCLSVGAAYDLTSSSTDCVLTFCLD